MGARPARVITLRMASGVVAISTRRSGSEQRGHVVASARKENASYCTSPSGSERTALVGLFCHPGGDFSDRLRLVLDGIEEPLSPSVDGPCTEFSTGLLFDDLSARESQHSSHLLSREEAGLEQPLLQGLEAMIVQHPMQRVLIERSTESSAMTTIVEDLDHLRVGVVLEQCIDLCDDLGLGHVHLLRSEWTGQGEGGRGTTAESDVQGEHVVLDRKSTRLNSSHYA